MYNVIRYCIFQYTHCDSKQTQSWQSGDVKIPVQRVKNLKSTQHKTKNQRKTFNSFNNQLHSPVTSNKNTQDIIVKGNNEENITQYVDKSYIPMGGSEG